MVEYIVAIDVTRVRFPADAFRVGVLLLLASVPLFLISDTIMCGGAGRKASLPFCQSELINKATVNANFSHHIILVQVVFGTEILDW